MRPRVYIETSVVSYFTARPSRDLVMAAHQQVTSDWWQERLPGLGGCVSELVLAEARMGDKPATEKRLVALDGIPVLETGPGAVQLSRRLLGGGFDISRRVYQ